MSITRMFLLISGALFLVVGMLYLQMPTELSRLIGMELTTTTAVIDVQGFYGGQMTAVGIAILLALRLQWMVTPALVMVAVTLAGTAAGRAFGFFSSGEYPEMMLGLFVLESSSAALTFWLLQRERAAAQAPA